MSSREWPTTELSPLLPRLHISTRDDCAIARRHGLGVEVVEYIMAPSSADCARIHDLLAPRLRGIDRRIFHGPIGDTAPGADDPRTRADTRQLLDAAYRAAGSHGISRLVFHSGHEPDTMSDQRWLANAAAFWREFLADRPQELAVHIENVADTEPALLAALIDAIDDRRVTACLDVGHAQVNSPYSPATWATILGPRIGHVHLHDNDGLADRHWPLGRGVIALPEAMDALAAVAPQCTFTLECEPEESLTWLARYCDQRLRDFT